MANSPSLRILERDLFKASIQDGILDIQLGLLLLMFVLPIYLSPFLGDFWSSVVFLPAWFAVLIGFRVYRRSVVQPRVGKIQYGKYRTKRLKRFNIIILVVNLIALGIGILSFFQTKVLSGWAVSARFSIIMLIGFSLAGFMLEVPRIYVYGILIAAAPLMGEYLYQNHGFSHHGLPAVFGFLSASITITGLVILVRLLRKYPALDNVDIA
jgi:hypothetical protein